MALLDEIKKSAEKAASVAAEKGKELVNKAGDAVETGKIKVKISEEEKKIDDLKRQIGEVVFNNFGTDTCCKEEIAGLVSKIKDIMAVIEKYKNDIENIGK